MFAGPALVVRPSAALTFFVGPPLVLFWRAALILELARARGAILLT
jgi:hypothetical protein